jgi:hypothetical protein
MFLFLWLPEKRKVFTPLCLSHCLTASDVDGGRKKTFRMLSLPALARVSTLPLHICEELVDHFHFGDLKIHIHSCLAKTVFYSWHSARSFWHMLLLYSWQLSHLKIVNWEIWWEAKGWPHSGETSAPRTWSIVKAESWERRMRQRGKRGCSHAGANPTANWDFLSSMCHRK